MNITKCYDHLLSHCLLVPCDPIVTVAKAAAKSSKTAVTDIDSFVPDEELDNNFLAEDGDEELNKLYEKET